MYQAREPLHSHCSVRNVDLSVYEWPGEEPAILLCHATSFHARCWDQIVTRLQGRKAIALDFRGHGESSKPAPPYSWRSFGEDLSALTEALGLRNVAGVGHSMGGHAVALAAALRPQVFRSLLLLDPVILPRGAYDGAHPPLDFVLRRRNRWVSSEEMFQRFADRSPFRSWDAAVLRDYCQYGLAGTELACPPSVEASIYSNSTAQDADIHSAIESIDIPVHVVRSGKPYSYGLFEGSPTDPALAGHLRQGSEEVRNDLSHFLPMEAPRYIAELILKP